MKKFTIITNKDKDENLAVTDRIVSYLQAHDASSTVLSERQIGRDGLRGHVDLTRIPEDADCILVLGGDGTLLQAARDVVDTDIPLLGINLGTLGYLAEIDIHSLDTALDALMADACEIEERMMLEGSIYHDGKEILSDLALNDIVIHREGPLRVVSFRNYVNDTFLNAYHSDGIIIATPTGSTGYSLSAGGPIISPEASLIMMTPLAPHTLNTRSIVFPDRDRIVVEIGEGRQPGNEQAVAMFDGSAGVPMSAGDTIRIKRSEKSTKLVKISKISFLEVLRVKMR